MTKNDPKTGYNFNIINPLTSPGEGVSVFTSPYLSAGAPALGEAKGLIFICHPRILKILQYNKSLYI